MSNILTDIFSFFTNILEAFFGLFDFWLFGKNVKTELIAMVDGLVIIGLLLLLFRYLLSKTDSNGEKILYLLGFVLIYVILQIWVF
jgi:hypothetical protein